MTEANKAALVKKVQREISRQKQMGQGTQRFNAKELKSVLSALQAPDVPEWNFNMDEAPRDGTEFLIFKQPDERCNAPIYATAKYVGRDELLPYGQCYNENCKDPDCPEPKDFQIKVLVTCWNHKDISNVGWTHWKHLTQPAKTTGENE